MPTDYDEIPIPDDKIKPREQWSASERRAEMYKLIMRLGHPKLVNQTELTKLYGKTHGQISQDMSIIREFIKSRIGKQSDVIAETVFNKAITGALNDGDYFKASQVISNWYDWMFKRGYSQKVADKVELNGGIDVSQKYGDFQSLLNKLPSDVKKKALETIKDGNTEVQGD